MSYEDYGRSVGLTREEANRLVDMAAIEIKHAIINEGPCFIKFYNLGLVFSTGLMRGIESQLCEREGSADIVDILEHQSQAACGLNEGIEFYTDTYGVSELAGNYNDCQGSKFN